MRGLGVVGDGFGPDEPGEFTGDGGHHYFAIVLAGVETPEPAAQTLLGFPRAGQGVGMNAVLAFGEDGSDAGGGPVRPGRLDQLGPERVLPAWVISPRCCRSPEECSVGTSPVKPMNIPAVGNRRQSHTSDVRTRPPKAVMPR